MPHWLEYVFRGYFWIAAIGFPVALSWALVNHEDMKSNYFAGYDAGEKFGWNDALDEISRECKRYPSSIAYNIADFASNLRQQ